MDVQQRRELFRAGEDVIVQVIIDSLCEAYPDDLRTSEVVDALGFSSAHRWALERRTCAGILEGLAERGEIELMPRTSGEWHRWRYIP